MSDKSEAALEQRDVGVGTSPDGRIAIAIDGQGHIIDKEDAQWISDQIDQICGGPDYKQGLGMMIKRTPGVGTQIENTLRDHGIDSVEDLMVTPISDLTDIQTIGSVAAERLKDAAYEAKAP